MREEKMQALIAGRVSKNFNTCGCSTQGLNIAVTFEGVTYCCPSLQRITKTVKSLGLLVLEELHLGHSRRNIAK
jgi:hypothetical protein